MLNDSLRLMLVESTINVIRVALSSPYFLKSIVDIPHINIGSNLCFYAEEIGVYCCIDLSLNDIYVSPELVALDYQNYPQATIQELIVLSQTLVRFAKKTSLWSRICSLSCHIKITPGEQELLPQSCYFDNEILFWYSPKINQYLRVDFVSYSLFLMDEPSDQRSAWKVPSEQHLQAVIEEIVSHYISIHKKTTMIAEYMNQYLQNKDLSQKFSLS